MGHIRRKAIYLTPIFHLKYSGSGETCLACAEIQRTNTSLQANGHC